MEPKLLSELEDLIEKAVKKQSKVSKEIDRLEIDEDGNIDRGSVNFENDELEIILDDISSCFKDLSEKIVSALGFRGSDLNGQIRMA